MISRAPHPDDPQPLAVEPAPGGEGKPRRAARRVRPVPARRASAISGVPEAPDVEGPPAPKAAEAGRACSDDLTREAQDSGALQPAMDADPQPDTDAVRPVTGDTEEPELVEPLTGERLRRAIEALLFASPEPLSRRRLRRLLREASAADLEDGILAIEADVVTSARGYQLVEDAFGLRFLSCAEFAPFIARLRGEQRRIRLSPAAFETLAVIAYKQPIGRADLDAIRGVQSAPILKRLQEWNLISIVGQDEEKLGRPHLYGTTRTFLEQFGLADLEHLPAPEHFREQGSRLLVEMPEEEGPPDAGSGTRTTPSGIESDSADAVDADRAASDS